MVLIVLQTKAHCPPFPFVLQIGKAFTYRTKEIVPGAYWKITYAFYKDNTASWATDEKENKRCVDACTEAALKDPKLIKKVEKTFLSKVPEFNRLVDKIRKTDFSKLTDKDICNLWKEFSDTYCDIYIWSEPIPYFTKDSLAEHLFEYLKKKVGLKKANQYLNLLVSPARISFIKREERDMLEIAKQIKQDPKNKDLRDGLLEKHTKDYEWIPYDYGVMIWGKKHFENELDELMKKDIDAELRKIDDYSENLKKKQKRILQELDIDKKHQSLFEDVRISAEMMDHKKEIFSRSHVAVRPFLKETAKRLGLSFKAVQYLMMDELEEGLLKGRKLDNKRFENRDKLSYLEYHGKEVTIWEGEKAKQKIDEFFSKIKKHGKEIKGIPASSGRYKGKVRIILDSRKIETLKKGEVLVTNMTSPDYTSGMKKAGAIITNEGGITCHAAVVSREMRIPCIIGTKNASNILKTGDLVEVDADNGTVRKIRWQ